jgi:hypothetical protein
MAPSKKLAGDATRYGRLNDQYHESEIHLPNGLSSTDAGIPPLSSIQPRARGFEDVVQSQTQSASCL